MGKFDGYLICTDCDGTLTDSQRKISPENAEAIRYFQENGGLFTVASGRYPNYIDEFSSVFVPNSYIVACNGAVLYDPKADRIVKAMHLKESFTELLCYMYENMPEVNGASICGEQHELIHFVRSDLEIDPMWAFYYEGAVPVSSADDIRKALSEVTEPACKCVFMQDRESTLLFPKILAERFGDDFDFVVAWETGFEALPKGAGKGQMIMEMKKLLPGVHTALGVGDYGNDITMFEHCDIGYAVANAPDWVRTRAEHVTVSNDESAIAKIIYSLPGA